MVQPYRQTACLIIFFALFLVLYSLLAAVASPLFAPIGPFLLVWSACFVVFGVVSLWIMKTKPPTGKWYWTQLAIILGGAFLFRVILVSRSVGLSVDIWRYLWDAHIILHGYSPYVYTPDSPALISLHTSFYSLIGYRQFPTRYPPLGELFFVVGYLLTPNSPFSLKTLLVLCDNVTCLALTFILVLKQIDARRVLLYAWCPLPIVEFAAEGHIDALAITWTVLAVLCTLSTRKRWRTLAGICIGLATLTKLYPILLLLVLVRRRDWALLVSCALTIAVGYLPFLLLSQGHLSAVLFSPLGQADILPSYLYLILNALGKPIGIASSAISIVSRGIGYSIIGAAITIILIQRKRKQMSMEGGLILLQTVTFTLLAMCFPWYLPALFPWLTLLSGPIHDQQPLSRKAKIIVLALVFIGLLSILFYLPDLNSGGRGQKLLIREHYQEVSAVCLPEVNQATSGRANGLPNKMEPIGSLARKEHQINYGLV